MGRVIEAYWDCQYCGTNGIGGSKRECPNCGKARGENVKFYTSENKNYVSKEKAASLNKDSDWVCVYCNSLNPASAEYCTSCGGPKDGSKSYLEVQREKEEREKAKTVETYEEERAKEGEDVMEPTVNQATPKAKAGPKRYIILLIVIAFIAAIVGLCMPKEKEATILAMEWERDILIEKLETFHESDWEVPDGARVYYKQNEFYAYREVVDHYELRFRDVEKQEIVGYEDVVVGEKDLGNGYFEEIISKEPIYETYYETEYYEEPVYREEPVYALKYYYAIDRWVDSRNVYTSEANNTPYWGEVVLGDLERKGATSENYWVDAKVEKDKIERYTMHYAEWQTLKVGQHVKLKVNGRYATIIDE